MPQSLLNGNSTPDPLANLIRTTQYQGRDQVEISSQESLEPVRRILTESDICRAVCSMKNVSETLEKMENRLASEMRKINKKLMNFEENLLRNLTNKFEEIVKNEMNSMKNQILKNFKENRN